MWKYFLIMQSENGKKDAEKIRGRVQGVCGAGCHQEPNDCHGDIEKLGVSKLMVYQWKNEFMDGVLKVYEGDRKAQQDAKQIDNLHRKIGELEMELDFAKWASRTLGVGLPTRD